jgi:hypothetical protein
VLAVRCAVAFVCTRHPHVPPACESSCSHRASCRCRRSRPCSIWVTRRRPVHPHATERPLRPLHRRPRQSQAPCDLASRLVLATPLLPRRRRRSGPAPRRRLCPARRACRCTPSDEALRCSASSTGTSERPRTSASSWSAFGSTRRCGAALCLPLACVVVLLLSLCSLATPLLSPGVALILQRVVTSWCAI